MQYTFVRHCASPRVTIVRQGDHTILLAREHISRGQPLMVVEGRDSAVASRYSLQLAEARHVLAGEPSVSARGLDLYPWRFINHGCEPNVSLRGRSLVALREISRGDEITLNYLASEFEMGEPFECACSGKGGCDRIAPDGEGVFRIQGYKYLSEPERARIDAYATEHVKSLARAQIG